MIFYLFAISIVLYSLKHYKQGLIFYLILKLFLVTNITVLSIPGIPLLTLEDAMNIIFITLYFVLKRDKLNKGIECPFQVPFILLAISYCLSALFSVAGFFTEIPTLFRNLLDSILLIIIICKELNDRKDFDTLFKGITIIMLFSCIYAFIEYSLNFNPIQAYEETLNGDPTKYVTFIYETVTRGYRCSSIFEHSIGAGINWAIYAIFCFSYFINDRKKLPFHKMSLITSILCVICIFLTKMRAPIVFFAISIFSVVNFRKKKSYLILFGLALFGVFLFFFISSNSDMSAIVKSLFNTEAQSTVLGSNSEMRFEQLAAAIDIMFISPILGLGTKGLGLIDQTLSSKLLGGESLWFIVLPFYGIFGVISYFTLINYSAIKIPRFYKVKPVRYLFLAYWFTFSLTSVPGTKYYLLFLFAFYFIKSSQRYNTIKDKNSHNFKELTINNSKLKIRKIY